MGRRMELNQSNVQTRLVHVGEIFVNVTKLFRKNYQNMKTAGMSHFILTKEDSKEKSNALKEQEEFHSKSVAETDLHFHLINREKKINVVLELKQNQMEHARHNRCNCISYLY